MRSEDTIKKITSELREEMLAEANLRKTDFLSLQQEGEGDEPETWRIRLELSYDPTVILDLDIQGDITIGRAHDVSEVIPIFPQLDTEQLGVSRKHIMLRPANGALYLIDLGSTNGTLINGHPIGAHIPHVITNGDLISVGKLEFIGRVLHQPSLHQKPSRQHIRQDLEVMLSMIARSIFTQFTLKDVIKQVIEMARLYTPADEVSVWLVDEMTGQLYLEDAFGMTNQKINQMPVASTMAGEVIRFGKPQRTNRRADGDMIKLKTGYMAEGVIYVPLTLGQVQVGVISAVHREPGKIFTDNDEKIMVSIADFAAVAIQNARLYQGMRQDLARRTKVIAALQYALSHDVRQNLHAIIGYASMLHSDFNLEPECLEMLQNIGTSGETLLELFERLVSMARLSQERIAAVATCSLEQIVSKAVENLLDAANAKSIFLQSHLEGNPYLIRGNSHFLYLSIFNLLDNAIKFTPEGGEVKVVLSFAANEITIRVADRGPGIPEEDLLDLFNRYFLSSAPNGSGGPGLGLEIVRATVEAHMGTVTAHNRKTGGAEIVVTLPGTVRTDWAESAGGF